MNKKNYHKSTTSFVKLQQAIHLLQTSKPMQSAGVENYNVEAEQGKMKMIWRELIGTRICQ